MIGAHSRDTDVFVICPETGIPTRVIMGWDVEGDPIIDGCARFWGDLYCDTPCWKDAARAFDLPVDELQTRQITEVPAREIRTERVDPPTNRENARLPPTSHSPVL